MGSELTVNEALCNNVARDPQLIVFETSAEFTSEVKIPRRVLPSSATFAKATNRRPSHEVTARDMDAEVQERHRTSRTGSVNGMRWVGRVVEKVGKPASFSSTVGLGLTLPT